MGSAKTTKKTAKKVSKAAGAPVGHRTGATLEEMQAALREHGTVEGAAGALGLSAPNFQARWVRRARDTGLGLTPGGWLDAEGLRRKTGDSPVVGFRLPEFEALAAAADEDGIEGGANELARRIVQRWLASRAKRRAKA